MSHFREAVLFIFVVRLSELIVKLDSYVQDGTVLWPLRMQNCYVMPGMLCKVYRRIVV